eukprot:g3384.t1 g3384   contig12:1969876-1972444(+)
MITDHIIDDSNEQQGGVAADDVSPPTLNTNTISSNYDGVDKSSADNNHTSNADTSDDAVDNAIFNNTFSEESIVTRHSSGVSEPVNIIHINTADDSITSTTTNNEYSTSTLTNDNNSEEQSSLQSPTDETNNNITNSMSFEGASKKTTRGSGFFSQQEQSSYMTISNSHHQPTVPTLESVGTAAPTPVSTSVNSVPPVSTSTSTANEATAAVVVPTVTPRPNNNRDKQDEYIKQGARVKALLSTALRAVTDGFATHFDSVSPGGGDKRGDGRGRKGKRSLDENEGKEMKLQDSQSQIQFLLQENSAAHQTAIQLQSKIDRTLEALQIAGTNAVNARAEADAADARAESFASQLNDLQSIIEETRRGMEVVRHEHDEVSGAARSVEGRLIQVESELTRAARVKQDAEDERNVLKSRAEKSEQLARVLQEKVEDYEHEVRLLKKDLVEMGDLEKVRSDRTHRIERELQDARGTLLEATSAAAEAESTVTSLRSGIEELRKENESLYVKMHNHRDSLSKDRSKQNEALMAAEKEVQKYKMKCEEEEESANRLSMEKTTAEKTVEQLKTRLANVERRLNDANKETSVRSGATVTPVATSSAATPNMTKLGLINSFGARESGIEMDTTKERKYVTNLPMRETQRTSQSDSSSRQVSYTPSNSMHAMGKDDRFRMHRHSMSREMPYGAKRKVSKSTTCCICLQEASGMMKNCQCDKINCDMRAHMTCIASKKGDNRSASAPAVLCD